MIEKRTIFDFIEKVFIMYGINMIICIVLTYITGAEASEISSLFELGQEGLTLETMVQLLGVTVVIVAIRFFFFTDLFIKNMSILLRTILMLCAVVIAMVIFIVVFHWFELNSVEAWIGFFIAFGLCFVVSTLIAILRERYENKRMSDALGKIKGDNRQDGDRGTK